MTEDTVPVRILAICRDMQIPTGENTTEGLPQALPNCRTLLIVYAPLGPVDLPVPDDLGVRDPPVEVNTVQVRDPVAAKFLALVYQN